MIRKTIALVTILILLTAALPALAVDAVSSATVNITALPDLTEDPEASILVVYFSTDDTVKAVAYTIAGALGAEVSELVPEVPYTEADLKYYTDCRADREQSDSAARPGLAGQPGSLERYRVIFIGYPIWHGLAPRILYTWLEGADLAGKTVVPFCTSASSGVGSSARELMALTDGTAIWLEAKRIARGSTSEDVRAWALSLGLKEETIMKMRINDTPVTVAWEDNDSVSALKELAAEGLTVSMSMYGGFEQVGPIGRRLPSADERTVTSSGDVVLYSGDQMVVFYGSNTWAYTRLGHITDQTPEQMEALLGGGDVTVTLTLE